MGLCGHASVAKPAAAPFTPADLTPSMWFDASDAASVTTVSTAVSQWNDKSGNSRHLTMATSGFRPAYTGTQNGLNVITFDGTDDHLTRTSYSISQPVAIFFVAKVTANTGSQANLVGGAAGSAIYITRKATSGLWNYYAGSNVDSATANNLGVHVFTAIFNGASSTLRLDGTQIAAGNPGSSGFSTDTFSVGAYPGGSSAMPGFVGEVIVCASPSSTLRDNCEAYLKAKWGTP